MVNDQVNEADHTPANHSTTKHRLKGCAANDQQQDQVYESGDCYYMPHDTPMAASNQGQNPVILVDIFVLPPGEETMRVIETGVGDK